MMRLSQTIWAFLGFAGLAILAACGSGQTWTQTMPQTGRHRQSLQPVVEPSHSCKPSLPPPCEISSQTFATVPTDRSRTTIGVNEQVTVSSGGCTLSASGDGTWQGTGYTGTLTAGPTSGTVTVTASHADMTSASIVFTVIQPSGILYARVNGIRHTQGRPDVGMQEDLYLQPDSVSFQGLYQKELDDTGSATGAWACFNGQGHNPNPNPASVGADIVGYGSKVSAVDSAYSGDCGYNAPFAASVNQDNIPDVYLTSPTEPSPPPFTTVLQAANLNSSGTLMMTKGAASASTTVGSPTSNY